ncbi:MAG: lasso peptide biosynthesis B2 protein [Sphaerochaetaceae bacterium]
MKSFRTLSLKEKFTVFSLWLQLALVDIRLTLLPYKFNKNWIYGLPKRQRKHKNIGKDEIKLLTQMTQIAGSHSLFFNMTCLRKALVIRSRLRKFGMEALLKFGTRKIEDKQQKNYHTHVWLDLEGEVIDPTNNTLAYREFNN